MKVCIFFLIFSIGLVAVAQKNDLQNWNSISAKISLGKKTDLHISELGSFSPANNFQLNFAQTHFGLNYKISRNFSLRAGDQVNYIPDSNRSWRNRIYLRGTFDYNLDKMLKAEHSLQFEVHDKNEHRYSQRIIFINGLSLRKRFSAPRLRPSVSYWLYYNVGGTGVQYYDEAGKPIASQTPDGFHRGRLFITLNSKISEHVRLSLFYINQQEFNLFTAPNRNINVVNPATGKISKAYDNFNAIGLSIQFVFGKD
ncbi:DUF2490 domain-containing protein [Chitinophaga vietnamensis]|uniref:DUF2490 domain-containing protein n=1 Tax=Chitinophaga vietnamensis TaxID=2593957 RepID=UPI00117760FA|nr:DUF2490 domain-containing protein [Chitinophaga vietnamensis]